MRNALCENTINSNTSYGVRFYAMENSDPDTDYISYVGSNYNVITLNKFTDNNSAGISQAYVGEYNLYNRFTTNYWNDWTGPDIIEPFGYVDVPYVIAGEEDNKD